MNHKSSFLLFLLFICCVTPISSSSAATDNGPETWRYNEIKRLENGYLEKTAGDPFIVFPEITRSTCAPMGVQLSISFDPLPKKPVLLEIFWSTDYLGFGEENKVFFVIHPDKGGKPNKIIVPLKQTAGFRQIRIDFPSYIDTKFKVEDYEIVSLVNTDERYEVVDAYYNLSIEDSLKPEIIIPYLIKAISHGPQRMLHDLPFFSFWLLLIIGLLFLIRSSARKQVAGR